MYDVVLCCHKKKTVTPPFTFGCPTWMRTRCVSTNPPKSIQSERNCPSDSQSIQGFHERPRVLGEPRAVPASPRGTDGHLRLHRHFAARSCSGGKMMSNTSAPFLISAVRTAWPATRPTPSFFKFRAYALNVLPSGFGFLDGDNPADPLIPREWRNVLPFCSRGRVRNENFSQIRRYAV